MFLGLCVVVFAGPACGQEIANWPAPETWSPHTVNRGVSTMAAITGPLPFIGVTPCRLADTRGNGFTGQYGPPSLIANTTRSFVITGQCSIPASAAAVSFNFGALDVGGAGDLRVFPAGGSVPLVSTMNYNASTPNIANAAIVPLGVGGAITVQADAVSIDLIIDVNGYYGGPADISSDVFLGPSAGNSTMTGVQNVGVGMGALSNLISGFANTAVGYVALGQDNFGMFNTAIGDSALFANQFGSNNTAVGVGALGASVNSMGNTGVGYAALINNVDGSDNVAVGAAALHNITTGSDDNIAVGEAAAINLTSGAHNIHIGNPAVSSESRTIRIGAEGVHTKFFTAGVRGVTTSMNDAVAVMIDSAGQLGTVASSRRFKRDIEDMGDVSNGLMALRPVTFRYKPELDPKGLAQYGLIAEEVAEVFPDLVVYDKDGRPETVRYHVLIPMLLNEVQKDRRTISDLTSRLDRLEALLSESNR